jgi:hypothetical protein
MPPALIGTTYDKRVVGKLPPVRLINRYVESAAANQVTGVAILPRPGLVLKEPVGNAPQRGVFREDGLFNGDLFNVAEKMLYREGVLVPFAAGVTFISGADLIRWAGTDLVEGLFFVGGGVLYLYDGTDVDEVTVPDAQLATDVTEINGYIIVQVAGTGRRYFIRPGEITIDPLDFFTAESSPDGAVATVSTASELWLFDSESAEVWLPTGNSDSPFQRYQGRIFSRGATSRDCVLQFDNTIFFVGEDNEQGRIAYRAADVPQRISTTAIEERFRLSEADFTAIAFILDGHAFYIVSCDQGSFAYDVSTGAWCEWQSYGLPRFRGHVAVASAGSPVVFGDSESNKLFTLDPTVGNDDGDPIYRVVGGGVPTVRRQSIDSLWMQCNTGYSSDPDYLPLIRIRFSKDGGNTWGDEKQANLGFTGQYNKRVFWTRCGQYRSPGFLFEVIDSDNVQTTFQYAVFNEPF